MDTDIPVRHTQCALLISLSNAFLAFGKVCLTQGIATAEHFGVNCEFHGRIRSKDDNNISNWTDLNTSGVGNFEISWGL